MLRSLQLSDDFLLEYVLHRWYDYIASLMINDPYVRDSIYSDIFEAIDAGVTRDRNESYSGELPEILLFNEHFESLLNKMLEIANKIQPYLPVVNLELETDTFLPISYRPHSSKFLALEIW